jgi:hypothetical protein
MMRPMRGTRRNAANQDAAGSGTCEGVDLFGALTALRADDPGEDRQDEQQGERGDDLCLHSIARLPYAVPRVLSFASWTLSLSRAALVVASPAPARI